jgi:hypothetical protein
MRGLPAPYNWIAATALIIAIMVAVPTFVSFL